MLHRKKAAAALAGIAGLAVAGSLLLIPNANGAPGHASTEKPNAAPLQESYDWKNVQIGGGGFVPGIIFNQTEPNLIYSRTDIGGAYRWNENNQTWTPLLDQFGWDNWGYNGVSSIATDPVDPDRVYVAAGMYTNDWDPNNGAILRSTDRGETWDATELPFKLGGNMPGRGMGERLAVDPNDNSTVYFGAPNRNGLWKSTDYGETWSEVGNFPNPGNWADDPNDETGYESHEPGVTWVTFDSTRPDHIYVGVADKQNTVYHSTDRGETWSRIPGQPQGYLAHKGVIDEASGFLYLATSNTSGPYDGEEGEVWRYNIENGNWTEVSPLPVAGDESYFGYSGLTVDRQNPGTLMVATQISWSPDVIFWRSTDNGQTWTRIWNYTSYPNRENRYTMDISSVPWLNFGIENPTPPEESPKLGWMTESVEIDPHNSDRMMYGTGATIYGTNNLTNWDANQKFEIIPMVQGLEETAAIDLISPPEGAPLISGLGDIGGFRHDDLDTIPQSMFTTPVFTTTRSLDYAEENPSVVVRVGDFTDADRPDDSHVAFSTDGGETWSNGPEPSGIDEGGTVAAAADGNAFVWAPVGQTPVHTNSVGGSWTQTTGLPTGATVESDRVNPNKFYGFHEGRFYVSTDGGATFAASGATNLPTSAKFKAAPGKQGDIWLAGDNGMFRSTDSGETFTKVSGVASGVNIGFGAPAPDASYPALYAVATIDGVTGVYRSDDTGQSWVRINDDQHQYGNIDAITGDPNVYGRVYLGTNGRGVLYADPAG